MRSILFGLAALSAALSFAAPIPPAAQLLPADTLALISVPDWDKAAQYWTQSAQGRLLQDPALGPFKAQLTARWKARLIAHFEKKWGIKLTDYLELLHGQATLAMTKGDWGARPDGQPGFVLLLDTKDRQAALATRLAEFKQKWIDSGNLLKHDRIRDLEFTTLIVKASPLRNPFATPDPSSLDEGPDEFERPAASTGAKETQEITFGQSGPLLIASNNLRDIERILARRADGLVPVLAEQGAYQADQAFVRDGLAVAWVHFASLYGIFTKTPANADQGRAAQGAMRTDKILAATGLKGIKTLAAQIVGAPEGTLAELKVNVPDSQRKGVVRLLTPDRKDSSPLPFVGAEMAKFRRWRIDGQRAWDTLENMLKTFSPEMAGLVQMGLQAAGKERDPNFDLKRAVVGNLGDDFLWLQKSSRAAGLDERSTPPSLLLVSSPQAEQFVQGLKVAATLMPLLGGEANLEENEFLGRRVFSLTLPGSDPDRDEKRGPTPRSFNFAAAAGYAAISGDLSMLQEHLRATETPGKSLRDKPGLAEAAQKVGGMTSGLFGYENDAETMRTWIEAARKQGAAVEKLLSSGRRTGGQEPEDQVVPEALDLNLLPPFERIAKYFHFIVYALNSSDQGLTFKVFAPVPPKINQ